MTKLIIEYDSREWEDDGELVLYRNGEEVDRIFAEEIVAEWMDKNLAVEYKEV